MMKKLLILLLVGMVSISAKKPADGYKVGDVARDFKLKNVDGKMVSMADYTSAKGFIVVFTCNHCPYSQKYEKRIMELDKVYASKGYPVLAISPNDPVLEPRDSFENMQKLAANRKYTFPYMLDETQDITRAYGASATPHVYILNKTASGNVVEYIGAIDDDTEGSNPNKVKYAELALESLLSGKKPAVTSTKAIGCRITWKKASS